MHLTSPILSDLPHIRHGFFGREGGVSEGIYASLNCGSGSGDDLAHVLENRLIVQKTMGASALLTCHQYHSASVVKVESPWPWQDAPQADAMVTNKPGIILGILTADCLPILFADIKNKIIGASHAGWKGAFSGVIENTIAAMKTLGADEIVASIGPAIAQKSYEVGQEFIERFLNSPFHLSGEEHPNAQFFIPSARENHHLFDLKAYAADRLKKAGVTSVNSLANDTCFEEDAFFSFRRATLKGESAYGRQISTISVTE